MRTNFPFNVLGTAQTVIRTQTVKLERFISRGPNRAGDLIDKYQPPQTIECSVQPVSKSLYQKMGLDFEKEYISILSLDRINDIGRNRTGDRITIDNRVYKVTGDTDWQRSAGWTRTVCVFVGLLNER